MTAKGDFFPARVNNWFPKATYAADVRFGGFGTIRIPAPATADTDGILAAQSIASAVDTSTFAATYSETAMGKFGRNVTVVASGAATSTVTVYGSDYLGQPMAETLTLNGTSAVAGKKAFKRVNRIVAGVTAGTTVDVGWGNVLGLPYKILDLYTELVSGVEASSAGSIQAPVLSQTLTSGDPRGTYTPHASNVPNASRYYDLAALWDTTDLYSVAHVVS